jgi:kynurenine 3-monooxygenase
MLESLRDFNYSQEFLEHGYKELIMPAAEDGAFRMEKTALHIWPRKSYMLIALPNLDGSFTCTLFFPREGEESFAALQNEREVMAFFTRVFPDAVPLMPSLGHDFFSNPTGSMVTVKCRPWHVEDRVMLLGDAAHAIVPFYGQGMNCGFEDCSALGELLQRDGKVDWHALFKELELRRKPNADAIADMALENFIEMRDTVADARFLFKKQVGFELEKRYPDRFIPRYSMVVFHPEISYAQARQRSVIQDKLLEELCAGVSSLEQIDWGKADELIKLI